MYMFENWLEINISQKYMLLQLFFTFSVFFLIYFFFYCCADQGTMWDLQKFLQCIIYTLLEFMCSTVFFICPSPIPGIVSTGIIFHLHTSVHRICTIFILPCPFPATSPLPLVSPSHPPQDLFLFHPPLL
jgi:hypothetical protein